MRLGDYTIQDLGIEWPDYFHGFSAENYDYCYYGVGLTEFEALEDCLDGIDLNSKDINKIWNECKPVDNETTSIEAYGYPCNPEYPPLFHVGIRYNFLEEERLERILKIKSLEPLRYESYERLYPSKDHLGLSVWGYVYKADGSASYGDFKNSIWPKSVEDYFTKQEELYFYIPYTSGSDYSGSLMGKSNAQYIEDEFGDNEWVHSVYGGHGSYAVAVGLTGLLDCDEDTFEELCEIIENLEDYPIIDEEKYYELVMEDTDEAWASWVEDDFKSSLEKEFKGYDIEWPDDLRTFFEEKREEANECWEDEGYGSGMYIRLDNIIEGITFEDIEDWVIQYEVHYMSFGSQIETYYCEDDAIDAVKTLRFNGDVGAFYRRV